jgi:hypothetical protein
MQIAQVAALYESVPPMLYGITERVLSFLPEELVRQGPSQRSYSQARSA